MPVSLLPTIRRKGGGVSIRTLNRVFYATNGMLVSLLAVFAVLLFLGQRDLKRTNSVRYDSYLLADELRQSSDDLTRLARTYVITGDPKFERMYWETLAIRNGEAPRPQHYERIYLDRVLGRPDGFPVNSDGARISLRTRMERLGFTSMELAKLEEAERNSNQLVTSERVAFNAMKGLFQDSTGQFNVIGAPDTAWARRILFDQKYHEAKAEIMRPVNEFYELLDTRTASAVAYAEHRANLNIEAVLLLLGLILTWLGFSYFVLRRKVANLVRLEHDTRGLGAGTYTSPFDVDSRDEVAKLARAFVSLDQNVAERTRALEQEVIAHTRAATALRKSEESYRDLFDNAQDAIYVHDLNGTYISANRAAERLSGYTSDEIVGKNFDEFMAPEYVERIRANLNQKLDGAYEIEVRAKDGRSVPLEVSTRLIYEEGTAVAVQGMARDITERRRTEAERQVIAEIVQADIATANLDELLSLVQVSIGKLLSAENCLVTLQNLTTDLMHFEFWADKFDTVPEPHAIGQNFSSYVMRTGQPLLLTKERESEIYREGAFEMSGTRPASWLGVPMRTRSRTIGVLVVQDYEKENAYSQRDLRFLATVGDQLGLAIERKQIEIELKTNEIQLTDAQHIANLGSWEWDVLTNRVRWSDELFRIFGLPIQESGATLDTFLTFVHPDDRKIAENAIAQAFRDRVFPHYEYRIIRPDGTVRTAQAYGKVIADESGRIIKMVGTAQDITERKRATEALKASESELRALFAGITDVIFVIDAEGRFLRLAPTHPNHLYKPAAKVIGRTVHELFSKEQAEYFLGHIRGALSEDLMHRVEYSLQINGTEFWFEGSVSPLSKDSVIWIGRDVTERKKAAQALIKNEERLQQSQKMEAIGTLAGGVAHDFNNLLTVILGNTEIALGNLQPADFVRLRLVEVEKAAKRAAVLTRQLLAFSRRQQMERRTIDLNHTIGEIMKLLHRIIGADVEVKVKAGPNLSAVFADPAQIEQVVMNLAVNARDAMPQGGQLSIETSNIILDESYQRLYPYAQPGKYAQITVSDNGSGMDEETKARLFEPFFTTKEVGRGTGLGLAMVYGIVKQHDGHINVYSEEGHGTTFKIFLPIDERAVEKEAQAIQLPLLGGTETILVTEDEEPLRILAKDVLEGLGYTVLLAKDGEEAVAMYAQNRERIDMLLLDVVMPRIGGTVAYERMRQLGSDVPVIFMTGYSSETVQSRFVKQNKLFAESEAVVIQKPYSIEGLGRKIREVLDASLVKV